MKTSGIDHEGAVLKRFLAPLDEIVFAYLHGSFLLKDVFRDVDIAVFLAPGPPRPSDDVEYEIALSLRLEKAIGLPMDIKILNRAPLSFRYHASRGILLLSRDESTRENFLCRTWSEYFDFARLARVYQEELTRARV
jgi:predicted nucleotidyltransferase